ncbi:MAG: DUF3048 domain-containing protein [Actinomycetota bacterium]
MTAENNHSFDPTTSSPHPRAARRPVTGLGAVLFAVSLLAAACGGSGDQTTDADGALPFSDTGGDETTTSAETDRRLTAGSDVTEPDDPGEDGSEIAQPTTTIPQPPAPTTPTTEGSGLPPVTTIVVGSGGDPNGIYRGRIGNLGLDQIVVPGVMAPPYAAAGTAPLTGLVADVPDRPAAVVKVDNGSAAVPQTGLNAADIVIEEEVEGGVTRFAAVFHSTPSIVGPVRSGRTTDLSLISSLGEPLLIYSGANQITEGILRSNTDIQNRSHGSASGYWRDGSRSAPSNLYSDTAPHWASAEGGSPQAQFAYRDAGEPVPGTNDDELTITYGASSARWEWDGAQWLRWQRGAAHLVVSGDQIAAANVVVIEVERVATGMTDSSGGAVPEFPYVGTGTATVFTAGKRIDGVWTRPTLNSVATLTTASGDTIELTPGRTWVQLIEAGSGALG